MIAFLPEKIPGRHDITSVFFPSTGTAASAVA
jgi:hypothetical protein